MSRIGHTIWKTDFHQAHIIIFSLIIILLRLSFPNGFEFLKIASPMKEAQKAVSIFEFCATCRPASKKCVQ
jgi:hypothetical protein